MTDRLILAIQEAGTQLERERARMRKPKQQSLFADDGGLFGGRPAPKPAGSRQERPFRTHGWGTFHAQLGEPKSYEIWEASRKKFSPDLDPEAAQDLARALASRGPKGVRQLRIERPKVKAARKARLKAQRFATPAEGALALRRLGHTGGMFAQESYLYIVECPICGRSGVIDGNGTPDSSGKRIYRGRGVVFDERCRSSRTG